MVLISAKCRSMPTSPLSANLRNVRLGEYTYAARNGTGADLDISLLQFGRSDGSDGQRVVQIANPYFEFVYRNAADGASREAIGMRFGFEPSAATSVCRSPPCPVRWP
jgi:hypothetical protein